MISYTEKGIGMHEAIIAAGHWLERRDEVWVSDNDTAVQAIIDSYVETPFVPPQVDMRQARLALLGAGLLDKVTAAIAALPAQQAAVFNIWWDYSTTVERASPQVAEMSAALGLTDAQVDQLFIAAAAS